MSNVTPTRDWNAFLFPDAVESEAPLTCATPADMFADIRGHVRGTYPINGVPGRVVDALEEVARAAEHLQAVSRSFGLLMVKECNQGAPEALPILVHFGFGPGTSIMGSLCGEAHQKATKVHAETTCPQCKIILRDTADKDR